MFVKFTFLFFLFQTNSSQTNNESLNFWLVIVGIIILFLSLLAVLVPNISTLLTSPQEFSGLGVNMKVSILTVFVLMGFILSFSSFALQWQNYSSLERKYKEDIAKLESEKKLLQEQEARARTFDMSLLFKPKDLNEEELDPKDWTCLYTLVTPGEPSARKPAKVFQARKELNKLGVLLESITPDTHVQRIDCSNNKNTWTTGDFKPFREGTFESVSKREGSLIEDDKSVEEGGDKQQ